METNGSIHWSPEAYPPPRPWTHMSDWKEPAFNVAKGPVVVQTQAHGQLPYIPEIDASVSYRVYPGKPYIITETSMRVNEALKVQALRNGEVVFKRGLLTHVAWYDQVRDQVQTVDLEKMSDLDELLMDVNVPWITFYNPDTGIAFGGIQLSMANGGVEHRPRVLNPYHYVIVGPIIYWSRAMNFTFASSASQLMTKVPAGSFFWERWAFVLYEPAKGDKPYAPLLAWKEKLTHPLRMRLVEEVEPACPPSAPRSTSTPPRPAGKTAPRSRNTTANKRHPLQHSHPRPRARSRPPAPARPLQWPWPRAIGFENLPQPRKPGPALATVQGCKKSNTRWANQRVLRGGVVGLGVVCS